MRVLLDACVPERFARFIAGHEVTTAKAHFGTTDLDDGPVLDQLTDHFDAFVTVDKNLRFQQNLRGFFFGRAFGAFFRLRRRSRFFHVKKE